MRLKTKWHRSQERSLDEIANTLGYILWRLGGETMDKMHRDGFNFTHNEQMVQINAEWSTFLLQCSGARLWSRLEADAFQSFIAATAKKLATVYSENMRIALPTEQNRDFAHDYRQQLNQRFADYAEFNFPDGEPSYPALRYFGTLIANLMGASEGGNKWTIEQVMEVEAPLALTKVAKTLTDLLPQLESAADPTPAEPTP